jgi:hypothetical protein
MTNSHNIKQNIEFFDEDSGHHFSIEFLIGFPLKRYWNDKYWPKTTQCLLKMDNLVISMGEVVKHHNDADIPRHGKLFAAKKAFRTAEQNYKMWPELRNKILAEILRQT